MHVFGHHDLAGDYQEITTADALQRVFEELHGRDRLRVGPAAITTEGEEVELPGLLIADALTFHAPREYPTVEWMGERGETLFPGPRRRETRGHPASVYRPPRELKAARSFALRFSGLKAAARSDTSLALGHLP